MESAILAKLTQSTMGPLAIALLDTGYQMEFVLPALPTLPLSEHSVFAPQEFTPQLEVVSSAQ